MRHKLYYKNTGFLHSARGKTYFMPKPYGNHLSYKCPSMACRYCKILQWIADHPNCRRKEIIANVYFDREQMKTKIADEHCQQILAAWDAGDFSWVKYNPSKYFAELLWADLIDYDDEYRYTITVRGLNVLKRAYTNDNARLIMR